MVCWDKILESKNSLRLIYGPKIHFVKIIQFPKMSLKSNNLNMLVSLSVKNFSDHHFTSPVEV